VRAAHTGVLVKDGVGVLHRLEGDAILIGLYKLRDAELVIMVQ
jgi:hypothetical protein